MSLSRAALALAAGATVACSPHRVPEPAITPQSAPTLRRTGLHTDHVVVISIDGLRPDAIARFAARTLQRLMREGRYTLHARTIVPSVTLPSHTSMVSGVDPAAHGITWNTDRTAARGHVAVPTIFSVATDAGFATAAVFSKAKFHHLEAPRSLDHARSPHGRLLGSHWNAARTTGEVASYLQGLTTLPNVLFVHIADPDVAGHLYGWMGGRYGRAVLRADSAVAAIVRLADERLGAGRYTVIVTADHGGNGRGHSADDPRNYTIPWIAWGRGVVPGDTLASGVRTMDTAATVLWLLGVAPPAAWVGRPVTQAFGR